MKTFSELLRISWHIYTTRMGFFVKAVALLSFPLYVLYSFIPKVPVPEVIAIEPLLDGSVFSSIDAATQWFAANYLFIEVEYVWYAIAVRVVLLLATFIISLAAISGTARAFMRKPILLEGELRRNREIVLPALITSIMSTVVVVLLTLLFVIPGIVAAYYLAFVLPIAVLTGKYYWSAVQYSFQLVYKNWWDVFTKILVVTMGAALLAVSIQLVTQSVLHIPVLAAVTDGFVHLITLFSTVFITVLFLDRQSVEVLKQLGVQSEDIKKHQEQGSDS